MYYLAIHDPANTCLTRFADFMEMESLNVVNQIGYITFTISAAHPALEHVAHLNRLHLYRREARYNVPWTLENSAILLAQRWHITSTGTPALTATALHANWLLSTRLVNWKAGTSGRSSFADTPAESIAKTLVCYNATALANEAEGRERDGTHTLLPIQVEADGGRGARLDWHCAYQELLLCLQRLACVGGGDFCLVPAATGGYEFRWYAGQMGSDRRSSVIFALPRGNMAKPVCVLDRRQEKTVAVVGGRGEGILRPLYHVYANDYSVENDVEGFVNGMNVFSASGMQSCGARYLASHSPATGLDFDVLQTPATLYGKHYFLGDVVSVRNPFSGADESAQVQAVRIRLKYSAAQPTSRAAETIQVTLRVGAAQLPADLAAFLEDWNTADNWENDNLDGAGFAAAPIDLEVNGGLFSQVYLSSGIHGGYFN